jgi:hypothetical protein
MAGVVSSPLSVKSTMSGMMVSLILRIRRQCFAPDSTAEALGSFLVPVPRLFLQKKNDAEFDDEQWPCHATQVSSGVNEEEVYGLNNALTTTLLLNHSHSSKKDRGGRVKFLNDVGNKPLAKARPSQPVRIVGFKTLPKAGDPIVCAKSEEEAKELIRLRESELINEERAEYENDIQLQVMGTAAKQGAMMHKAQQKYGFDTDDGDERDWTV